MEKGDAEKGLVVSKGPPLKGDEPGLPTGAGEKGEPAGGAVGVRASLMGRGGGVWAAPFCPSR